MVPVLAGVPVLSAIYNVTVVVPFGPAYIFGVIHVSRADTDQLPNDVTFTVTGCVR